MPASHHVRPSIGGYVLAGGRSTRMGRDKALLELAGKPLVQHAVLKLERLTNEVHILSRQPELAAFAPLVPDLRESCGPLGGMEAALAHTRHDWILVLPVDMPFLPTILLERWVHSVVEQPAARVAFFTVDDVPHPALCLLHREVASFLTSAAQQGRFKLYRVFEAAATELSAQSAAPLSHVLLNQQWDDKTVIAFSGNAPQGDSWRTLTEAQVAARPLWFANLNTPQEFDEAVRRVDALDT